MESSLLWLLPLPLVVLFGRTLDVVLLFGFGIYINLETVQEFSNTYLNPTIVIDIAKATTALFALLQLARYILGLKRPSSPTDDFPAPPLFFPCRTSHVRMFPAKHGFAHSYLLTGIPVGWKGSVGGMISEDDDKEQAPWYSRVFSLKPGGAWYSVNGDDYLDRGHVEGGLQGKLKKYLENQGIDPNQYSHAYLVTAAKFLGYASNPLSVWYLYTSTRELSALVLEVNNTFDERRIYFLEPNRTDHNSGETLKPARYTGTWEKDFYVSVFNTRAGIYSLAAYDPFSPNLSSTAPKINSTVTLSSPEGQAKLIARVYSAGDALDPATMSMWQKTIFLASWWHVGFLTFFPRTIYQALVILLKRGLPWVFRPEPRKGTIARHADETERFIERIFRSYLRDLVESSDQALKLRYIPAGLFDVSEEIFISPSAQLAQAEVEELEIRVLTPLFYSRIIQYPNLPNAILSEYHESSTIALSNTDLLSKLEFDGAAASTSTSTNLETENLWDGLAFTLISTLRRTPPPIICLDEPKPSSPTHTTTAVPPPRNANPHISHGATSLDAFVLLHCPPSERREYTARILKVLFTQHIALGWTEILDLEIFIVRSVALWIMAGLVF